MDWLMRVLWSEAGKNLTLDFSRSQGSMFTNPVFPVISQNAYIKKN